ncbi:MAG TPA: HNH endonuclease signature motif containing protein [Gemmataceae bacterium]|nr:HNH endonuclease signature motif containing protein [Gemmataceae bacterium]
MDEPLRRLVRERSAGVCDYCQFSMSAIAQSFAIDHIIARQHGGATTPDNLANIFQHCNQAKGSDIGSIYWETGDFVRFFHPRTDRWADHFELVGRRIESLSPIGLVTARILGFNTGERILERQSLQSIGRYPSDAAMRRMQA